MKFDIAVSTGHSSGQTNKSLDISIDVDINVDLNTITSTYVVVKIYTNNIVTISILTVFSSITSTTNTTAIMNPELKYSSEKYSLYKLQELDSQMINAYSSVLSQSNVVLCLHIIHTIILFCYNDNKLPVTPKIANLSAHMKMARVSLEIEINVTDFSDASLNQDIDNDIIPLR